MILNFLLKSALCRVSTKSCFKKSIYDSMNVCSFCSCPLVVLIKCDLQIPHLRPVEYKRSRLSRNRRTVNRAYGGVLSGGAVRERFVFSSSEHEMFPSRIFIPPFCLVCFFGIVSFFLSYFLTFCFFCRIIRAFLVEEQKIVKKVLKIQKAKEKVSSKS